MIAKRTTCPATDPPSEPEAADQTRSPTVTAPGQLVPADRDQGPPPFALVPFSVMSDPSLSSTQKCLYGAVKRRAHPGLECQPQQEVLANDIGRDLKTVYSALQGLKEAGYVVTRRGSRGLTYTLCSEECLRSMELGLALEPGRDPAAASVTARAADHGVPERRGGQLGFAEPRGDRGRLICKAIFDNPDIGELGATGIAVYVGLIVLADDYGKLEVDWRRIRVRLFPYTPAVDVEGTARLLADRGVIELYQVCAKTYLRHPDWFVYQKLRRPRPTVIPDPDGIVRHLQRTNRFGDVAFDQPMTPAGAASSLPELQEVGSTASPPAGAGMAASAPSSSPVTPVLATTLPPVADRRGRHDGDPPRACMVSCDPDLTDAAVRVYWVMARHSDHEGRCVIGLSDIAAMAFKVVEQIPALIDQLRRRGHVVTRKAGAGLAYFLPGVPDFACAGDRLPLNGGHP